MYKNKPIPAHVCLTGQEVTADPYESTGVLNRLSLIIGEWEGSEEQAKKIIDKVELYIRNSRLHLQREDKVLTVYD
jgi:hemerythrin-like domain-containing protein